MQNQKSEAPTQVALPEYSALWEENARLRETYERACGANKIYSHMAYALARDYVELYCVNIQTGEFVECHSDDERGVLCETRRATDFFESCVREAEQYVHPEDRAAFLDAMNREFLMAALDRSEEYEMSYRRIQGDRSFYVQMRISRMRDDKRLAVVAVWDINDLVMKSLAEERVQEERIVYARLQAVTGNFVVVYVVEPETDHYRLFSSTDAVAQYLVPAGEGEDFYEDAREITRRHIHPEDLSRFLAAFTKEGVRAAVERDGIFTLGYRLMVGGVHKYFQLKAAMVEESKGPRLIVGLNDIDAQVRQEQEIERRLAQARARANIDALTGVKNRHAYLEAEDLLNSQIMQQPSLSFALVVLDVNDLKKVNDIGGHQAGDQYLRDACRIICEIFKHSPVFRVGGDEFVVISQGVDYAQIEERLQDVSAHNEDALQSGGVVMACGMARFMHGDQVATVFDRADRRMYEDKDSLKTRTKA